MSADLTGPMRIPDCTWGYRYLLVIIDHFSRYTWIFPLITKGMCLQGLKTFKAHAENVAGLRMLLLQTDNGGEFSSKEFVKWTQDSGIEHIPCAPYGSSMNSYVERVIKSVITHASTMLWHARVKEDLWALAAKASVYLHNRVPNRSLENEVTPYEMWHGTKPHVGHIRVWGCRTWAAIPKKKRTKWESKSAECILVGFYDTENLYQLWDIEKKELIKRRDVIFHEHILGHASLERDQLRQGYEISGEKVSVDHESDSENEDIEEMYPVFEGLKDMDENALQRIVDDSIPLTYEQAMKSREANKWQAACDIEHESMLSNDVYDWVSADKSLKVLPSKWIFTLKRNGDGEVIKYKARIVAGGHRQRAGIDYKETFAPVAKFGSLRILLTLAAINDWEGEQGDIVTAFLYGDLDEVIYMTPPDGIIRPPGKDLWRLKKSLYGLKQSPRCFYTKLDGVLKAKSYTRVMADYGVWVQGTDVILLVYVDDMLLLGTQSATLQLKSDLSSVFHMKWSTIEDTVFIGLPIRRLRSKKLILLSQERYAEEIVKRFGLGEANVCATPMDPNENWVPTPDDSPLDAPGITSYQAAIGSLIYLMLGTRPDLGFSVGKLAQYSSAPTERHWKGVKRILRYVKKTKNTALVLGNREQVNAIGTVTGYFDSAYMDNTLDRHSTMGYIFLFHGSSITWASKKQRTIALSTTEAEYLAGTEATKESMWIVAFLEGIGTPISGPVHLLGDNQGANVLAKNPEYHSRTKHIHGRQRFLSEMVEQQAIAVTYVPTSQMIADTLTKPLPRDQFEKLRGMMGLQDCVDVATTLTCCHCGEQHKSRNELHRHLKKTGHSSALSYV